jgi:hypothetical protein
MNGCRNCRDLALQLIIADSVLDAAREALESADEALRLMQESTNEGTAPWSHPTVTRRQIRVSLRLIRGGS